MDLRKDSAYKFHSLKNAKVITVSSQAMRPMTQAL